jgi:hypothetical protein
MYPPPHMTCTYPPPHMTCMYPPPHMTRVCVLKERNNLAFAIAPEHLVRIYIVNDHERVAALLAIKLCHGSACSRRHDSEALICNI